MRDLFTTIGTRYLIAILNLALIFVNAKVLVSKESDWSG